MNGQHIGEYQEYEGLIEMRARAYAPEEDLEELMQEGYFAYIQAIESYDPEKKACFRS
jgi:DNA-directed RNA polymerase specialized sigma subunit